MNVTSGLIAKFGKAGKQIRIVCLTNGDKGTSDFNITSAELAVTRSKELQLAAAELNATAVLLGYEDGELENTYEVSDSWCLYIHVINLNSRTIII